MKIVLLSGGSGKRFWRLSNSSRSKQFLKVLKNKNNIKESMLQRMWKQLESANLIESILVSTGVEHLDIIQSQLGTKIPLIVEPQRRDTFPAVALATTYINTRTCSHSDEVVCILPVDHFTDDQFYLKVKEMEKILVQSGADMALIGLKPNYPSD